MIIYSKITRILCLVDEFCKEYDLVVNKALEDCQSKRQSIICEGELLCLIFYLY